MSSFWSWLIIILVVGNILGMLWLLIATSKSGEQDDQETTGHEWDGITELNNPLPRWWFGLFIITIIFSGAYLYLYPGLGSYQGSLGWSQVGAFEQAKEAAEQDQLKVFSAYQDLSIEELASNPNANGTGARLFANNCSTCHGSVGQGALGFPNLADQDWLYGGSPDQILSSIKNGRAGNMPNLNLKPADVAVLARYLKYLSGEQVSDHVRETGQRRFTVCAACHGSDAKGNIALGAPNLTDDIWLHGSQVSQIEAVLRHGVQGNMPSFSSLLNDEEIRLLAAYVLSLSKQEGTGE